MKVKAGVQTRSETHLPIICSLDATDLMAFFSVESRVSRVSRFPRLSHYSITSLLVQTEQRALFYISSSRFDVFFWGRYHGLHLTSVPTSDIIIIRKPLTTYRLMSFSLHNKYRIFHLRRIIDYGVWVPLILIIALAGSGHWVLLPR